VILLVRKKRKKVLRKPIDKKAFLIQTLRRASYRWPHRNAVLKRARVARGQYKCELCSAVVDRHNIKMDHIQAVVDPAVGWVSLDVFADRLLCDESGFQAICTSCHDIKTKGENKIRHQTRKEANEARKLARKKAKKKDPKTNKHTKESLDDFLSECGIIIEDKK